MSEGEKEEDKATTFLVNIPTFDITLMYHTSF